MSHALIAVVDDDASILRALQRLLVSNGFAVKTFDSGDALRASDDLDRIDCVILDIHLNGLSGFDVQEQLVKAGRVLPIIFITANDDAATRERARHAASQYLPKPFDERALIEAVYLALGPLGGDPQEGDARSEGNRSRCAHPEAFDMTTRGTYPEACVERDAFIAEFMGYVSAVHRVNGWWGWVVCTACPTPP
jgi:FixJ family two-component response regulator